MTEMRRYDVIVIGGAAAGLSGATALARSRRSVLVIDSGEPRNAPSDGVHNYLGHDGLPPAQLLARGREEFTGYGGEIREGFVSSVTRLPGDAFAVTLRDGGVAEGSRILVATGLRDELPDLPGLAERWGRDVLHCPYCHGWEMRDRAIGVLATGPLAVHQASLWRQLSKDVILFSHTVPDLDLSGLDVEVVDGVVTAVETRDDHLSGVRLADGRTIARDVLVVSPVMHARAEFLKDLGLEPVIQEMDDYVIGSQIPAGPTGATDVPGVWVAGNVSGLMETVVGAAAAGLRAAVAINADLIMSGRQA
ncbi:NAD(P)/FAD-dependent oxidoreductase [Nonomuraea endophytica]|uniref:Thioredoxin reductase n=1 Tax=Nonomuraea endophytica TaxID=714136 RepID=A0A7W8A1U6_9ACTN|nr:NAD(P)/FAD-dependent oxidoreductase [Nonomuraea endophytica]MBB5077419.1 thioredoxin reductase [Nonomuraea endophytica]